MGRRGRIDGSDIKSRTCYELMIRNQLNIGENSGVCALLGVWGLPLERAKHSIALHSETSEIILIISFCLEKGLSTRLCET